jgi:hypothetical protein
VFNHPVGKKLPYITSLPTHRSSFPKIPFTYTKRKHTPLADTKPATQKQTTKRQKLFKIKQPTTIQINENLPKPQESVPTPHSDHKHDSPPNFHYQ